MRGPNKSRLNEATDVKAKSLEIGDNTRDVATQIRGDEVAWLSFGGSKTRTRSEAKRTEVVQG